MRQEEERFLEDPGGVFNAAHMDALRAMARATGLDYGGIDCGVGRDGRIVVFEANAAMLVHDEKTEIFCLQKPIYRQDQAGLRRAAVRTLSRLMVRHGQRERFPGSPPAFYGLNPALLVSVSERACCQSHAFSHQVVRNVTRAIFAKTA